jgi:predicted nucleic acid-binding Zn ribbon protein
MNRCYDCGAKIPPARSALGYDRCLTCGEERARQRKHTIVPMHKSNYMVVTDRSLLAQITRPGRGNNH